MFPDDITPVVLTCGSGAVLLIISLLAGWADRRHMRRRDLDRISLINWRNVSAIALMPAIVLLSIGAHLWFSGG
jgi:hypothetical protein